MSPEGPYMRKMFHDYYTCFHTYELPSEQLLLPPFLKTQYPFGIDLVILDGSKEVEVVRENLENIAEHLNTNGVIIVNSGHDVCAEFIKARPNFTIESWAQDDKQMEIIYTESSSFAALRY